MLLAQATAGKMQGRLGGIGWGAGGGFATSIATDCAIAKAIKGLERPGRRRLLRCAHLERSVAKKWTIDRILAFQRSIYHSCALQEPPGRLVITNGRVVKCLMMMVVWPLVANDQSQDWSIYLIDPIAINLFCFFFVCLFICLFFFFLFAVLRCFWWGFHKSGVVLDFQSDLGLSRAEIDECCQLQSFARPIKKNGPQPIQSKVSYIGHGCSQYYESFHWLIFCGETMNGDAIKDGEMDWLIDRLHLIVDDHCNLWLLCQSGTGRLERRGQ